MVDYFYYGDYIAPLLPTWKVTEKEKATAGSPVIQEELDQSDMFFLDVPRAKKTKGRKRNQKWSLY